MYIHILGGEEHAAVQVAVFNSVAAAAVEVAAAAVGPAWKTHTLRHRHQVSNELDGALQPNHSGIIALVHAVDVPAVKAQIPEATKATTTEVDEATAKDITETALRMVGAAGMVGFGEETRSGIATPAIGTENTVANWMHTFFVARPGTIYAGTSEVQRNIVGERVLGLPKEPRGDKGTWKESQAAYS